MSLVDTDELLVHESELLKQVPKEELNMVVFKTLCVHSAPV